MPRRPLIGADRVTLVVIIVFVLTAGFVAGTTAMFNASTRSGNNTFTIASISSPTAPVAAAQGNSVQVSWTGVPANPNNAGVGYRVLTKPIGGPTTTGGIAPGCGSGAYTELTYVSGAPMLDTTAMSGINQGEYRCYAVEGVWPCCPSQGKTPVVTSLQGRIQIAVQLGYVVTSWAFQGGNGNGNLNASETIVVNFNQPVAVSTGVTTAETVCADPANKVIHIGASWTSGNTCGYTTETQVFKNSLNPLSARTITLTWALPSGSCTVGPVAWSSDTAIQNGLTTCFGAGNYTYSRTTGLTPSTYTIGFPGIAYDVPTPTVADTYTGQNSFSYDAAASTPFVTAPAPSFATVTHAGTWGGQPDRWPITNVGWTNCTTGGVACRTMTVTLGTKIGTNTPTIPASGTWTIQPTAVASRMTSSFGSLSLCTTNPPSAPSGGLCRPTAPSAW